MMNHQEETIAAVAAGITFTILMPKLVFALILSAIVGIVFIKVLED
jgi:hypothetical protein